MSYETNGGYGSFKNQGCHIAGTQVYENYPVTSDPSVSGLHCDIGSTAIILTGTSVTRKFVKTGGTDTGWEEVLIGSIRRPPLTWFDTYEILANKLTTLYTTHTLVRVIASDMFKDNWIATPHGSGVVVGPGYCPAPGNYTVYQYSGSNSGGDVSGDPLNYVCANMSTKCWFLAARLWLPDAPTTNTQLFIGLQSLGGASLNRVGIGFDGAHNSTHLLAGTFQGTFPFSTSLATSPSTVTTATLAALSTGGGLFDVILAWSPSGGLWAAVNGEAYFPIGGIVPPSASGYPVAVVMNQLDSAPMYFGIDKYFFMTEL